VILPARNRKDLEEVPPGARERLEFVFLDDVEQAMWVAMGEDDARSP
jgi:ATP-dependent Lon protease